VQRLSVVAKVRPDSGISCRITVRCKGLRGRQGADLLTRRLSSGGGGHSPRRCQDFTAAISEGKSTSHASSGSLMICHLRPVRCDSSW
jgi:hypothetical protein